VGEAAGPEIGLLDRLAGAGFGAVRVAFVAVTLVLVFAQVMRVNRQPSYMTGSRLRPIRSADGQ